MLWRVIQAHGGALPADVKVIFANTGKERPETLDFVERCSQRWSVEVVWLEFDNAAEFKFRRVDHATASRDGRPFDELIRRKQVLPNPLQRFCTQWLKIKMSNRYVRRVLGWKHYENAIGMRADEPKRVAKLRPDPKSSPGEEPFAPLARAGITLPMILAFWESQPFDLGLMSHEGNCDLCFLKGAGKLQRVMHDRPDLAEWWIERERELTGQTRTELGSRFRKDRPSYAALLEHSKRESLFDVGEEDELTTACHCTD